MTVTTSSNNPTPDGTATRPPRRGWRRWTWLMLALPLMLGGITYNAAYAHGGGRGGPGGFMHERMQARMERILTDVGATDSQKAQVKTIWVGLAPQLKAAHQEHKQLREQIEQAISAPTIDAAAIEKLRQQSVQSIDRTSTLLTQGMVSTARVLTPEQRQKAVAELHRHPHHPLGGE
ncbi:MAG TPA: Spy/CpxP family protein refolding chaperone [Polyangia bacterium]|nr:Spy/CpxP family protein refolding chaperone [Polyangia bacterium]